ncbi:unnamed protein product [Staurois parvus]|uniref:Large ribosomal subunit protein uL15 n=1 Tax=Staurois parvus TaxID=386267 RepID=A0ABN9H247_9NEOB|nr:unnamed protein product [Staurois parvus]
MPWYHQYMISFDKYHPDNFGKVSTTHYHLQRNRHYCPTNNLDKLWILVSEQTILNHAKNPNEPAPAINAVHAS